MQKIKTGKTLALSLLLASAVAMGGAAIALGSTQNAYADDYTQELDGTKVFYTGIRGAEITYSPAEGVGEDTHVYTMFKVGSEQTVEYRQNLAYSWRTSATDSVTFSMEIGFANTDFERYVIRFQSQQHALTQDKVTENFIVFTPSVTANMLDMSVVQTLEDDTVLSPVASYAVGEHIKIAFGEFNDGEYPLHINDSALPVASFKNVYEPFATYVSSGDNAVTPLTFSATFAEDADEESTADMVLYDINGQTFELESSKEDENGNLVYETTVIDNAAPVMCFSKTPSYLIDGDSIDFSYKVIDVIGTSTRATAYYYVLSGDQYAATDFDYDKTDYSGEDDDADANPFIEVTSGSSIRIIRDENTFIPSSMLNDNVYGLVKLYYKIADRSGSTAQSDIIFADWYAKDEALVDIKDIKGSGESSIFLKLIDESDHKPGLTYAQKSDLTATQTTPEETDPVLYAYKQSIKDFQSAYQAKIDEAIAALKDDDGNVVGKLFAGTDSKFYLPSFDNLRNSSGELFDLADTDEYLFKGDYQYSIYYKAKTSGSATSLDANALSISLTEADVNYRFTIFITDSFGNDMRYPTLVDGEIVWETITVDDVWNEDFAELLPFFEFHVSYKEATATPPDTLSIAYVNTSYSGVSFTIKGVSGTYTTKYDLYVVDRDGLNEALGETLDYETFKNRLEELFNNPETRKYFTTVKPASSLLETDENYETFKELNWNSTSITFTPLSVEDFYVVRLALQDNNSKKTDYSYTAVTASVETTSLKGESDWVENNLTSIILFSFAGVCLVALVVLLVVKPKDKGDIDAVYSEEIEKENAKKGKKKSRN
ncbi:MAG: hypothetical protein ACI4MC_00445 [Candidatus Coproplasma sp.]